MAWLFCDGWVAASAELASTRAARRRGLLGRDRFEGVLVLPGVRQVHTVGMRFAIDVAWIDGHGRVLRLARLGPWRVSRIVWRTSWIVEAEAGAMTRWGVVPGAVLEVVS